MENLQKQLSAKGYCKFENKINSIWVNNINDALPAIFSEHENIRRQNSNPIQSQGVAMNVIVGNQIFIDFLQELINNGIIDWIEKNFFHEKFILNSFSALNNLPEESSVFHKKIHRDIRGYSSDIPLMLNMLVMLDDFTIENGGTLLLPESHLVGEIPTSDFFAKNAVTGVGKAGDIIIWNSNLFHASGINRTNEVRRALPITFSLPYYKQLLDYPRALGYKLYDSLSPQMRDLLGYNSRVPASINEWYSPEDKLLYKK